MKLVQIFLPLYDNNKRPFAKSFYNDVRIRLNDQLGGVTLYRNAAVEGLSEDETGRTNYDELIIAEALIEETDQEWWRKFKQEPEQIFRQDEIWIRFIEFEKL